MAYTTLNKLVTVFFINNIMMTMMTIFCCIEQ